MNLAEQAVFTSAETSRTAGYQLVAKSEGLSEEEARALSTWGPSHGSLLKCERRTPSINFHPLPGGNYCVSRTTASGNEYSGRGIRIYTQCLIVAPEILRQFANNAFAVMRAASASGLLKQYEKVPATLAPVPLVGRAPAVDPSLFSRARREFGNAGIARLVESALACSTMAVAGTSSADLAIAVLLNCLPPQLRPEFSFSTGLRASARRPYRVLSLGDDAEERRRTRQIDGLTLIDLADKSASQFAPTGSWARAIYQIVEAGRSSLLTRWFENHSSQLTLAQLSSLGLDLLDELNRNTIPTATAGFPSQAEPHGAEDEISNLASEESSQASSSSPAQPTRQLAHAAHARFTGSSAAEKREPGPSGTLACEHPQVVASLEALDDLVFAAIKGDNSSLVRLQSAWPQIKAELGEELLGQSREQYLRYALHVWDQCVEDSGFRPTDRAVNALEVLCLLFDEV
jgi:hypothetical protein